MKLTAKIKYHMLNTLRTLFDMAWNFARKRRLRRLSKYTRTGWMWCTKTIRNIIMEE